MVYGYFPSIIAELSSCNKDHMTHKAYDISSLALYRRRLPISVQFSDFGHIYRVIAAVTTVEFQNIFITPGETLCFLAANPLAPGNH